MADLWVNTIINPRNSRAVWGSNWQDAPPPDIDLNWFDGQVVKVDPTCSRFLLVNIPELERHVTPEIRVAIAGLIKYEYRFGRTIRRVPLSRYRRPDGVDNLCAWIQGDYRVLAALAVMCLGTQRADLCEWCQRLPGCVAAEAVLFSKCISLDGVYDGICAECIVQGFLSGVGCIWGKFSWLAGSPLVTLPADLPGTVLYSPTAE